MVERQVHMENRGRSRGFIFELYLAICHAEDYYV